MDTKCKEELLKQLSRMEDTLVKVKEITRKYNELIDILNIQEDIATVMGKIEGETDEKIYK